MRRFKFIGKNCNFVENHPVNGDIYNENYTWGMKSYNLIDFANMMPDNWEEVFENQFEPEGFLDRMHKDTDLGYFAGIIFKSILVNADRHSQKGDCQSWNYEHLSKISIQGAKELIKQLNQETK